MVSKIVCYTMAPFHASWGTRTSRAVKNKKTMSQPCLDNDGVSGVQGLSAIQGGVQRGVIHPGRT